MEGFWVKREDIYKWLNELNTDYRLGLDEAALRDVTEANGEDDAIERIKKYVDPSPITPVEFMDGILETLDSLLEDSPVSEERQTMIFTKLFNSLGSVMDQEFVETIAASYSRGIPDKLSFMRGKIHYTLAALGILYQVAEADNDDRLKNYVQDIRKKRGFSD